MKKQTSKLKSSVKKTGNKRVTKSKDKTDNSSVKEKQDLLTVFQSLYSILKKYEPPFTARADYQSRYDLWSEKNVIIEGRKRKEVFFAGLIIQSNYVGFYYMPVYAKPEIKELFPDRLLKLLKGKSCFHIMETDKDLLKDIKSALEKGFKMYKEKGWV